MKKQLLTAILICGASVLTSYSNDDKPTGQQDEYAGVPLIILDTDIGSSADDLFALEMLYHYEDGTEAAQKGQFFLCFETGQDKYAFNCQTDNVC